MCYLKTMYVVTSDNLRLVTVGKSKHSFFKKKDCMSCQMMSEYTNPFINCCVAGGALNVE